MARLGRYFLPDQPLHVIQRGNNREAVFFDDEDRARYCAWLAEAAERHECAVHAYVLMTNHVHLLVTPGHEESLPRTLQTLGRRYVRHVNAANARTGTLWEGRYRAAPIDGDAYFLACCRYIELNPVRAGMVRRPGDFRWSSYRAHAAGAADALASDHPLYRALGRSAAERQQAYRDLCRESLEAEFLEAVRRATNGGWALGAERFQHEIARALDRRVAPLPRGPKRRPGRDKRQLILL